MDIIEYSKKSVSEQIADKTLFNSLVAEALKDVAQSDRIILDTGDGVAIALMGEPEEALFVSLTIRDAILNNNKTRIAPMSVRTGINLGSVRVVKDLNGQLNILGDGINVAQRIMTFAEPNQIMVSRSYYEVTSRLTQEFTSMFTYSGVRQDKHVREYEIYLIKPTAMAPNADLATNNPQIRPVRDIQQTIRSIAVKATSFKSAAKGNIKVLSGASALVLFLRKHLLWVLPILAVGIVFNVYNNNKHTQENQVFSLELIKSMDKSKVMPNSQYGSHIPVISAESESSNNQLALTNTQEKTIVKSKQENKLKIANKTQIKHAKNLQISESKVKVPKLKVAEHKLLKNSVKVKNTQFPVSVASSGICTQAQSALSHCK